MFPCISAKHVAQPTGPPPLQPGAVVTASKRPFWTRILPFRRQSTTYTSTTESPPPNPAAGLAIADPYPFASRFSLPHSTFDRRAITKLRNIRDRPMESLGWMDQSWRLAVEHDAALVEIEEVVVPMPAWQARRAMKRARRAKADLDGLKGLLYGGLERARLAGLVRGDAQRIVSQRSGLSIKAEEATLIGSTTSRSGYFTCWWTASEQKARRRAMLQLLKSYIGQSCPTRRRSSTDLAETPNCSSPPSSNSLTPMCCPALASSRATSVISPNAKPTSLLLQSGWASSRPRACTDSSSTLTEK